MSTFVPLVYAHIICKYVALVAISAVFLTPILLKSYTEPMCEWGSCHQDIRLLPDISVLGLIQIGLMTEPLSDNVVSISTYSLMPSGSCNHCTLLNSLCQYVVPCHNRISSLVTGMAYTLGSVHTNTSHFQYVAFLGFLPFCLQADTHSWVPENWYFGKHWGEDI